MPLPEDINTTVATYVTADGSAPTSEEIEAALTAEASAQAKRCRIPEVYPPDLVEALCRRVARNLAVRKLPLGIQPIITDTTAVGAHVGGTDPEIKRLETPYRKLVKG